MKAVESDDKHQQQVSEKYPNLWKFKRKHLFDDTPKSPLVPHYDSLLFSMSNPSKRTYRDIVTTPTSVSNNNNNISVRSGLTVNNPDLQEMVMSRSSWFSCLKQAYDQLLTS